MKCSTLSLGAVVFRKVINPYMHTPYKAIGLTDLWFDYHHVNTPDLQEVIDCLCEELTKEQ